MFGQKACASYRKDSKRRILSNLWYLFGILLLRERIVCVNHPPIFPRRKWKCVIEGKETCC